MVVVMVTVVGLELEDDDSEDVDESEEVDESDEVEGSEVVVGSDEGEGGSLPPPPWSPRICVGVGYKARANQGAAARGATNEKPPNSKIGAENPSSSNAAGAASLASGSSDRWSSGTTPAVNSTESVAAGSGLWTTNGVGLVEPDAVVKVILIDSVLVVVGNTMGGGSVEVVGGSVEEEELDSVVEGGSSVEVVGGSVEEEELDSVDEGGMQTEIC